MMFEAYVTNLGMYPERGVEVGEYLRFPTTIEEVQALFSRIGIDGKRYEEYFITDYQSDVLGLYDHLGEYESLDELNYLAHLLEEMTQDELEKLEAVMDAGEYTGSVKDLINLTQNLDCFEFYPGVKDEEELGRMYILEFEALTVPEHLIDYIDYEAYGRDVRKRNAFHLERLTSRRLRLKPEEEYTVYEVDASDEDADILNYDDLDSADDFV